MPVTPVRRTAKRKTSARKISATRKKASTVSTVDRMLHALPVSQHVIERGMTWTIIAVLMAILLGFAQFMGWPQQAYDAYARLSAEAGFEVKRVEITGMNRVDQVKVYEIVLAEKDRAMPLVNVEKIRADLIRYGWVKDVRVSRRLPDMLVVEIVERKPAAVWRRGGKQSLIDDQGVVLEDVARGKEGDLPILNGDGANEKTDALAKLIDAAPSLRPQIVSASWIGNRRWDLGFKTGETLALPEGEEAAAAALRNFARLDGIHRLLGGEIIYFDLRDPERAYLRKAPVEKESGNGAVSSGGDVTA